MRVLLVRPPVPEHTMGLKHLMVCEPLELEYVAAGLDGHDVQIVDLIVERGLQRRIRAFRPDVVATSCYINGVNEAVKVCRAAKRWNPDTWTVVGGVHASRAPEDFVDDAVDVIVLGDGTTALPELLAAISCGTLLDDVPGLALPERDGSVTRTAPRPYMGCPDELPRPRRDLVSHLAHRYHYIFYSPLALLKTTWGCPHRCRFCFTWTITGGEVHSRGPESIVDELADIEARDVYIVDDVFLSNRTRLRHIARLIRERGIEKRYLCFGRSDFIANNEDVIAEWAELGLAAVLIGLEAATDGELESMRKRSSVATNRRAIEVLRRHGVDTYGSLIPDPDYGREQWENLWKFIDETGLYYLNISPLTPLPGTAMWPGMSDDVCVPRRAHGLWDLCHVVLPTAQGTRLFYRELRHLYTRTLVDIRRANRLTLRSRPPVWSAANLRVWWGAFRVWLQFGRAHRHHELSALAAAMSRGPPAPANARRLRRPTAAGPPRELSHHDACDDPGHRTAAAPATRAGRQI